ncbi:MAG: nuclear transport factor 2 family protein [Acidobacteriota bacterium]
MSTPEIAAQLVNRCNDGQSIEAIHELYADDVVSIEFTQLPGGFDQRTQGKDGVVAKNEHWFGAHEIHDFSAKGPYLIQGSDQFGVIFTIDVTRKADGQRIQTDEIALYTVADGKISQEEFFVRIGG